MPDIALSAPPSFTPVPARLSDSAPMATPTNSNAAPDWTLTPPAVVPNAEALVARITPELIVTAPV